MNRFLKKESGSIAIEALASLFLLFVAVFSMWGISILIYNQSKLTSATQLASQSGILLANRVNLSEENRIKIVENGIKPVFAENLCGMLPSQQSGSSVPAEETCRSGSFQGVLDPSATEKAFMLPIITCSDAIEETATSRFLANNCNSYDKNRAVRVVVGGQVSSPFSLIGLLGGTSNQNPSINETSEVYSFSAK